MSSFDFNSFLPNGSISSSTSDFDVPIPQKFESDGRSCNIDVMFNEFLNMDVCTPTYTYGSSMDMPPLVELSFEPCASTHLFHSGRPDNTLDSPCLDSLLETTETLSSISSFSEPFPLDNNENRQPSGFDTLGPEALLLALVTVPEAPPPQLDMEPYILPNASDSAVTSREEPPLQRVFSPCPSSSSYTDLSSRPSSRASTSSKGFLSRRARPAQKPRNIQVPLETYLAAKENNDGRICPICRRVQSGTRPPDFKRHLLSHCVEAAALNDQHVCHGVPYSERRRYGIGEIEDLRRSYVNGVLHVGGCGQSFSRRDARQRHIRNSNNKCVGEKTERKDKCPVRPKAAKRPRRRV
ncbi:hypothetical protein C8Q79DRAFT_536372 [Trametes meyenii]|nr:hypothetical protein C8Q79DRAFT_536372 [Trametes meyenii]